MRLTDEQIDNLKDKNETSLDERPLSRQECRNLIRTIEAQQQEIERLNKVLDDWKYNAKCDADHIAGLLADKDEQTDEIGRLQMTVDLLLGRVKQLEKVAKDLYFAYINKEPDCPHEFEIKAIEQYKALLGGKEDEK